MMLLPWRMKSVRFGGRFIAWDSCSFLVAPLEVHGRLIVQALVATVRTVTSLDVLGEFALCLAVIVEPGSVEQLARIGLERSTVLLVKLF